MAPTEGFKEAGFTEFSRTEGTMRIRMMGQVSEAQYTSVNHINGARNIGYCEVVADGKTGYIFLSRTSNGDVMTIPGDKDGPLPFPMEGFHCIMVAREDGPVENFYDGHIQGFGDLEPVMDEAFLKEEVPKLPQRSADVAVRLLEIMMGTFAEMGGEIMGAMAEAMGEGLKDMGGISSEGGEGAREGLDDRAKDPEEERDVLASADSSRRCPACGKEAGADDRTCPDCGEELD
jgi:hypothetical protein